MHELSNTPGVAYLPLMIIGMLWLIIEAWVLLGRAEHASFPLETSGEEWRRCLRAGWKRAWKRLAVALSFMLAPMFIGIFSQAR